VRQPFLALGLLAAFLGPVDAGAQYLTGKALLELCARHGKEPAANETEAQILRDVSSSATCRGYLMGVADRVEDDGVAAACIPPATTLGDLLAALRGYAERHPDELHRAASQAVAGALRRAYPCPPTGTPAGARTR
jgi:hypothetical protein